MLSFKALPDTLGFTEFEVPEGEISMEGMIEIERFIKSHIHPDIRIPEEWGRAWLTTKSVDGYVGTLTKRIAKLAKKQLELNVNGDVLSEVGNIARRHTLKEGMYYFDIVKKIDWRDGEFGDLGSCFWGGRQMAVHKFMDNGVHAMRFFAKEGTKEYNSGIRSVYGAITRNDAPRWTTKIPDSVASVLEDHRAQHNIPAGYVGWGRSWLGYNWPEDGMYWIFNTYPGGLDMYEVARVLALMLSKSYRRMSIDTEDSDMWFNNGTIIIASQDKIDKYVNRGLPEVRMSLKPVICCACGKKVDRNYEGYDRLLDSETGEFVTVHSKCVTSTPKTDKSVCRCSACRKLFFAKDTFALASWASPQYDIVCARCNNTHNAHHPMNTCAVCQRTTNSQTEPDNELYPIQVSVNVPENEYYPAERINSEITVCRACAFFMSDEELKAHGAEIPEEVWS